MGFKYYDSVWKIEGLPSTAKLVLLAVAECASQIDARCWPSIARLSRMTGLGDKAVRSAINLLVQRKFLEKTERYNSKGRTSNTLRLKLESVRRTDTDDGAGTTVQSVPVRRTDEPINLEPINGSKSQREALQPDFDKLWSVFPKRDGSNPKHAAWEAYQTAVRAGANPAEMLNGAYHYAENHEAEAQFICSVLKWLQQQRWLDDRGERQHSITALTTTNQEVCNDNR